MEKEPKLKLPEPFKVSKKIQKKLDLFADKISHSKFLKWEYSAVMQNLFYLYLFNKYKTNCLIYDQKFVSYEELGLELYVDDEKFENKQTKSFYVISNLIINCISRGSNIIIIPLTINISSSLRHANVLIYRKNGNIIEHFEPHGAHINLQDGKYIPRIESKLSDFISYLNKDLEKKGLQKVILKSSNDVCPYINGLQTIEASIFGSESGGYCAAWCMFFTELALKNPTIPSDHLLEMIFNILQSKSKSNKITKTTAKYLKQIIRGYVLFISEKIDTYFSILFGDKISVETIVNKMDDVKNPANAPFLRNLSVVMNEMIELEYKLLNDPRYNAETDIPKLEAELLGNINENERKKLEARLFLHKNINKLKDLSPISVTEDTSESKPSVKCPEGRCIKVKTRSIEKVDQPKECPEGKEINAKTGRCVNIKSKFVFTRKRKSKKVDQPKECPEGKEINPKTGRCVNIKSKFVFTRKRKLKKVDQPKECPEGKEINPKTGRCIKIKTRTMRKPIEK